MFDRTRCYRRLLVDMHIPDWDPRFLAEYDPVKMAEVYQAIGATSAMIYCQSHVGLCYWPTKSGKMYRGLSGRDIVADMLRELKARALEVCAYYSVIYNNWAYLEYPEWRICSAGDNSDGSFAGVRYGYCCPNNPDYRDFVMTQLQELIGGYEFDGLYVDMTFWPAICLCEHCRRRFQVENSLEIPETIDWYSRDWCAFQSARERWISEFAGDITSLVKTLRPGISVSHNFATSLFNWTLGLPFESSVYHDLLGADFYGDSIEQLVASKFMSNLAPNRRIEFQTSLCHNLRDHVRLKPFELIEQQVLAAALFHSSFMIIDAIDPDGSINTRSHKHVRAMFDNMAQYEPYFGGEPIEDIGVYFSGDSKVDFLENGISINNAPMWCNEYPHITAVRGVCRVLQRSHIPFGIITRKQLKDLGKYSVVILPNVLRMDREEVDAIRNYVLGGGKLYADRYTSLTETCGLRHDNFMLSDVFGCDFAADDLGRINYLKPVDDAAAAAIDPQDYLSQFPLGGHLGAVEVSHTGMVRLSDVFQGDSIATLTLPYASPYMGSVLDQNWSSIHSSPPWTDTSFPVIIENTYGDGKCIYSAADIECVDSPAHSRLFVSLIERLTQGGFSCRVQTHPNVWVSIFHQPENMRFIIGFLNVTDQSPLLPVGSMEFRLECPVGKKFTHLELLPDKQLLEFTIDGCGCIKSVLPESRQFVMIAANYKLTKTHLTTTRKSEI